MKNKETKSKEDCMDKKKVSKDWAFKYEACDVCGEVAFNVVS